MNSRKGKLYLVGTPIGNLEDITLRALRVLKEVDLIVSEDTRTARKLLTHYGIKKPLIGCPDAQEGERSREIAERLAAGSDVALISEAGTPAISDPGYRVVAEALKTGFRVVPIPGPSACLTALVASGLPVSRFAFEGFLPSKATARKKKLFLLRDEDRTLIFYESPRRTVAALKEIRRVLGERKVAVARELTKKFEEIIRGEVSTVIELLEGRGAVKGEVVLLVEGAGPGPVGSEGPAAEEIEEAVKTLGVSRMEAIKLVAGLRGKSKSEIYREYHRRDKPKEGKKT